MLIASPSPIAWLWEKWVCIPCKTHMNLIELMSYHVRYLHRHKDYQILTYLSTLRHLLVNQQCCGSGFSAVDPDSVLLIRTVFCFKSGFRSLVNSVLIWYKPVLGIRDILMRIRISVYWIRIRLLKWLSGCKKINFFSYFFLLTYPQAHYLQSYKFTFC